MLKATRFPELNYRQLDSNEWRYVDASTGESIGMYYNTEAELLADLERYATTFGAAFRKPPQLCRVMVAMRDGRTFFLMNSAAKSSVRARHAVPGFPHFTASKRHAGPIAEAEAEELVNHLNRIHDGDYKDTWRAVSFFYHVGIMAAGPKRKARAAS